MHVANETRLLEWLPLTAVVLFVGAVGCASSSNQKTSEPSSEAEPTSREANQGAEVASEESASSKEAEESGPEPVELASIIGADTSEGLPEGCPKQWQEMKGREYDGTIYACSGFRVPELYRKPTVQIGVRENMVRRITLQAFYESGDPIREKFAEVTDLYQQRCDAQGAGGDAMVFRCDGYVAQVSHRERAGSLRVILGLKNWDLPQ